MLLRTIINHCQDVCIRNMFTIITSCFLKNMHQSCQWSMIFNTTIHIHDKISSILGETHFCRIWFWINHLLLGSHFTIKVWKYRNLRSQGKIGIVVILTRHSLKRETIKIIVTIKLPIPTWHCRSNIHYAGSTMSIKFKPWKLVANITYMSFN